MTRDDYEELLCALAGHIDRAVSINPRKASDILSCSDCSFETEDSEQLVNGLMEMAGNLSWLLRSEPAVLLERMESNGLIFEDD